MGSICSSCCRKNAEIHEEALSITVEEQQIVVDEKSNESPKRPSVIVMGERYESTSVSEKIQHMNLSGFPNQLGPFETPITTFTDTSFHFLDQRLQSENPFFIIYRESFNEHQLLTKLIWNFPLVGQTSPRHSVTLNDTARESANIPPDAKYYVWSYPIDVEWRSCDTSNQRDLVKVIKSNMLLHNPDFLFLLMGGYIYFDEKFRVVRVTALRMPRNRLAKQRVLMTAKGLNFGNPIPFEGKYISPLMRHDRFKDAPAVEGSQRAKHFAWLLPREEVIATDQTAMTAGPHGAFVYLFSNLISRDSEECGRNVYFNVLCHDITCCPTASTLPCNKAQRSSRKPKRKATQDKEVNILLRSDTKSSSKGHTRLVPFTLIQPTRDRRNTEINTTMDLPDLHLDNMDSALAATTSIAARGVSLNVLKDLAKEFDQIKNEPIDVKIYGTEKPSYGEILVNRVIKQKTKEDELSYAELMMRSRSEEIFNCNAYISHSWDIDFSETVRAVEKFEEERTSNMKLFYFCDFVSINHWLIRSTDEVHELRSLIGDVREMVVVLSPWDNPTFFHRTWFIFEIAQAIKLKTHLSIVLPPSEYKPLKTQIRKDFGRILKAINGIDSKTAKASENSTMEYLQQIIENELGGFSACTRQVGSRLKRWLAWHILEVDDEKVPNEFPNLHFLLKAADFLQDKSEFCQRRALKMLDEFGNVRGNEDNLKAKMLSARILCNLEELEQSERCTQQILRNIWTWDEEKEWVRIEHRAEVVKLIDLLAEIKSKLGKKKKAIWVQERAIALSALWFGKDSKSHWACREHLGTMLMNYNKFEDAKCVLEDCLTVAQNKDWDKTESDRVVMALTKSRLGMCLYREGEYQEARLFVDEALEVLEENSLSIPADIHQAQCLYHDIEQSLVSSVLNKKSAVEKRTTFTSMIIYEDKEESEVNLEDITCFFRNDVDEDEDNVLYVIKRSASNYLGINADDYALMRDSNRELHLNRSATNNTLRDLVQIFFSDRLLTRLRELNTNEGRKIADMFLECLPYNLILGLPRDRHIQSHIDKISSDKRLAGITFRRSCAERPDVFIDIFDREFLRTLQEASWDELKESEDVDVIEIEQMTVELKRNFHYTFKPDEQIKAELECRTRERVWMKRENQSLHRAIRAHITGINTKFEVVDYITKVILSYLRKELPIPYIPTNRTAEFHMDDLVLVLDELEREGPLRSNSPGRIVKIKDDSVELEFIVEKQDPTRRNVSVDGIRPAFTWRCWRCQKEPKPDLWRDVYKAKNWTSCIVCGLVTKKTGAQYIQFVKRYLIEKTLYGGLYFGFDSHFDRDVAIKECDKEAMSKKRTLVTQTRIHEDVKMEIELHTELCNQKYVHPGIIEMFDQYDSDSGKKLNLVLEWADGGELFGLVKDHFLIENSRHDQQIIEAWQKEVQSMFFVICSAMKKIHDSDIVHRDMSLENVLLVKNREESLLYLPHIPRICDFGVAQRVDKFRPKFIEKVGKRGYWSQECCDCYYDGKANDVWCLGVMLFTMLLGGKPYGNVGDARHKRLINGDIRRLIKRYQSEHLVPSGSVEIMEGIFKTEKSRLTVDQILSMRWCVDVEEDIRRNIFPEVEE